MKGREGKGRERKGWESKGKERDIWGLISGTDIK